MMHFNLMKSPAIVFRAIAAAFALLSLSSCVVTYQFAPIEAWVVDAETGKPIEGAVVTANWELVKGSFDGPRYYGQLEVKETVTDANGRFAFDGFSKEDSSGAELRGSDPQILIFKAGHKFERFTNDYHDGGAGMTRMYRTAAVNGKTVRLARLRTSDDEIGPHGSLHGRLEFVTKIMPGKSETAKCYWQNIPRMIRETRIHELQTKRNGVLRSSIYDDLIRNSDQYTANSKVKCNSPSALFAGIESK